jgi:hypothetical protein
VGIDGFTPMLTRQMRSVTFCSSGVFVLFGVLDLVSRATLRAEATRGRSSVLQQESAETWIKGEPVTATDDEAVLMSKMRYVSNVVARPNVVGPSLERQRLKL